MPTQDELPRLIGTIASAMLSVVAIGAFFFVRWVRKDRDDRRRKLERAAKGPQNRAN